MGLGQDEARLAAPHPEPPAELRAVAELAVHLAVEGLQLALLRRRLLAVEQPEGYAGRGHGSPAAQAAGHGSAARSQIQLAHHCSRRRRRAPATTLGLQPSVKSIPRTPNAPGTGRRPFTAGTLPLIGAPVVVHSREAPAESPRSPSPAGGRPNPGLPTAVSRYIVLLVVRQAQHPCGGQR